MNFWEIFLLFWTCSIIGWLMEVTVYIVTERKLINRGFFVGPYCPIYGFGALLMLTLSSFKDHPVICFFLALILCSILEYLTSYILEKLFKLRWWDYSNYKYQINGRICLINALAFGALGVFFTRYLYPLYLNIINSFSNNTIMIVAIIVLIITLSDIIFSFNAMSRIKNIITRNIDSLKNKDATVDVRNIIRSKFKNVNFLIKRIINSHDVFTKEKDIVLRGISKVKVIDKNALLILFIMIIIGSIFGLVITLGFKIGEMKIVIPVMIFIMIIIGVLIIIHRGKYNE